MDKVDLTKLDTEKQNTKTLEIDTLSIDEVLKIINDEDKQVAYVVEKALPQITKLVEATVERLRNGGRLIYIGAGSSGRLAFADASECPPTYGVPYETVQGIIAGGFPALYKAQEGAEDDIEQGIKDVKNINLSYKDILVGIAASGRTPYVIGALNYANEIGCHTGSITCVHDSEMSKIVKNAVEVVSGEEVITGSTRMKAGTAQKMVLNMLSTATMIALGKVYNNLMVDVLPTNIKLVNRAIGIIMKITDCSLETAEKFYYEADQSVKLACLMILSGLDRKSCEDILLANNDHLKKALASINK